MRKMKNWCLVVVASEAVDCLGSVNFLTHFFFSWCLAIFYFVKCHGSGCLGMARNQLHRSDWQPEMFPCSFFSSQRRQLRFKSWGLSLAKKNLQMSSVQVGPPTCYYSARWMCDAICFSLRHDVQKNLEKDWSCDFGLESGNSQHFGFRFCEEEPAPTAEPEKTGSSLGILAIQPVGFGDFCSARIPKLNITIRNQSRSDTRWISYRVWGMPQDDGSGAWMVAIS